MKEAADGTNPTLDSAEIAKLANSERKADPRAVMKLVKLHLVGSSRLPHLAVGPAAEATAGSIELYSRLRARDSIDSIYCSAIVALLNAIMGSFAEAPLGRDRDDHLARAYEGLALLTNLVEVRENRRALLDDTQRREEVLNELMSRYALTDSR
jgi:hypothetical protein